MKRIEVKLLALVCAGSVAVACNGKLVIDHGDGGSPRDDGSGGSAVGEGSGGFGGDTGNIGSGGHAVGSGGYGAELGTGGQAVGSGGYGAELGTGGQAVGSGGYGAELGTGGQAVGSGGYDPGMFGGAGGTLGGPGDAPHCPGVYVPPVSTGGVAGSGGEPILVGPTATTHWAGNATDCPVHAPTQFSGCTVAAGEFCAYSSSTSGGRPGFYECVPHDQMTKIWYVTDSYDADPGCPLAQPDDGVDCSSNDGGAYRNCFYPPHVTCQCLPRGADASDAGSAVAWRCVEAQKDPAPPPSVPSGSKQVRDLTNAERTAWCEWLLCADAPPGMPLALDSRVTSTGLTQGQSCTSGTFVPFNGTIPLDLSLGDCYANLAFSTCQAPTSDLSDCVRTLTRGTPTPAGCGRYLDTPDCSGTIVTSIDDYTGPRSGAAGASGDNGAGGTSTGAPLECPVRVR